MNEELKPCPFCGAPAYISKLYNEGRKYKGWYVVECTNVLGCTAGVVSDYFPDEDDAKNDAIKKWNRRAKDESND